MMPSIHAVGEVVVLESSMDGFAGGIILGFAE